LQDIARHQDQGANLFTVVLRADGADQSGHAGDAANVLFSFLTSDIKGLQMTMRVIEKQYRQWNRWRLPARGEMAGATRHPAQQ
jgi:hypothetical protein